MKRLFLATALFALTLTPKLAAAQLYNPLDPAGEGTTVYAIVGNIIAGFLGLVGAAALVMFIWGGFLWLTAGGNSDRIQKGKSTLTWAVIGLAVIFGAYALSSNVINYLIGAAAVAP